jgi:hypothetical protein
VYTAENSKQIFPEKELRGYSSKSYIHVSVSDLYISMQDNRWTERGNISINVEILTEAVKILFWEYRNPNFFAVYGMVKKFA